MGKRTLVSIIIIVLLSALIALAILFILPDISSCFTNEKASYSAIISSGDKLAFSGTIISSLITIAIVVLSYLTTQRNIQEEQRLTVCPYIVSSSSFCDSYKDCESALNRENATFYITRPNYADLLLKSSCDPFSRYNLIQEISQDEQDFFKHNIIICYDLYNYGAGNAVNLNVSLNDNGITYPNSVVLVGSKTSFVLVLNEKIFHSKYARSETESVVDILVTCSDINQLGFYEQHERFYLHKYEPTSRLFTSQGLEDVLTSANVIRKLHR